jgi:DNA gyrase subunit A
VAEIKLRNINKEYILKRTAEVDDLEQEIADLEDIVSKPKRIQKIIISELEAVKKKYNTPRRTEILYDVEDVQISAEEEVPDYPVHLFLSKEGYFKKITPQSLRMSGEQKYKEGDESWLYYETTNRDELLIFTNQQQCYKARLSDFNDCKASLLGDYLPSVLGMDASETIVWAGLAGDYSGSLFFFFENGKAARVALSGYQTQTRRKKLTGAYSDKSPLVTVLSLKEEAEVAVYSSDGRAMLFNTAALAPKATRTTQGVAVMAVKKNRVVEKVALVSETPIVNHSRYRARTLPVAGALLKPEDRGEEQMTLL